MQILNDRNKRIRVVVAACVVGVMSGLSFSWSIWVRPICEQLGWETDTVALMGNILMMTFATGAMVSGQILNRIGPRATAVVGAFMFGGGFILSALAKSPVVMYLSFGVLSGIGVGFTYIAAQFSAITTFPERRGTILGIYLTLFGLSLTIFSPILAALLGFIGVRATLISVGVAIIAVCSLFGLMLDKFEEENTDVKDTASVARLKRTSLTVKEAVRTRAFWFYVLGVALAMWTYQFFISYITVFMTETRGFAAGLGVLAVSLGGAGSALGRLISGFLTDRIGCKKTFVIFGLVTALSCAGMIFLRNGIALAIMVGLLQMGYGGRVTAYTAFIPKHFGPENASGIYGVAQTGNIPIDLIAPLATAWIRQSTGGSFTPSFVLAIVFIAAACWFFAAIPKARRDS